MSEVKWIKITTDMFDNRKIKAIRKLPEGNNIILIWVMLLSLAGRCNASGMIFLTQNIPYTNKMLADELDFEESVICIALDTLEKFGMISRDENLFIEINNWVKYQSVDGMDKIREQNRLRNIEYRARKKNKANKTENNDVTHDITHDITNDITNDITHDVTVTHSSISRSYSFSISNNISNINYMLNKYSDKYKEIIDNKELVDALKEWMEYKDQKEPKETNHYGSERGLKTFFTKVLSIVKNYSADVMIELINDSMASNYQGIVWDMAGKKSNELSKRPRKDSRSGNHKRKESEIAKEDEEEIINDDGEYIDFGKMTDEEYAEFLRIQAGRRL